MLVSFHGWTLITMKMVESKAFHVKPKINIVYHNEKNVLRVPNNKKIVDYYENLCVSHLMSKLLFCKKWWKKKLFMQNQSINTVYRMRRMYLWCPLTKRFRIILRICVCLIWWMNLILRKLVERKVSHAKKKQ